MGRGSYLARTQGGYSRPSSNTQQSRQSQSDNRFGGNIERANTRVVSPRVAPQIINRDNEKDDSGIDIDAIRKANEARNDAAYEASLAKQADMRRAIDMAYGTNRLSDENQKAYDEETLRLLKLKGTKNEVPDVGIGKGSIIDESTSNFQNLDNDQKQQLIDSGFAAAESSGVLGGTMGAELVTNQLKKQLAEATTDEEANVILGKLQQLGFSNVTQYDPFNTGATAYDPDNLYNAALGYDPSAVYSFSSDIDRYEGGTYLKDAFYNMQSPNLTPKDYTNYMNQISAFGHSPQKSFGGSGGGGGYGYGYGGGGGSGGGGGYMYDMGGGFPQTYQRGQVGPGNLQEQVNQAYLSGGKGFARGGIVSLLRL